MLKPRIIPCLLLKNHGLVKTVRFESPTYVGDPINTVRILNKKEVDELVFLDITATIENCKPNFKLIANIASEAFMPFSYGGGIRDIDDVRKLIRLGVEKVVINSHAMEDHDFIREIAETIGSQSVVVSIDVKKSFLGKYEVFTHCGTKNSQLDPAEFAWKMQQAGAGELFLTSMDRDGTMSGYDIALLKKVTMAVDIPVIASGGAGKIEDFTVAVKDGMVSAVAAGSMFIFYGIHRAVLVTYPSAAEINNIFGKVYPNC